MDATEREYRVVQWALRRWRGEIDLVVAHLGIPRSVVQRMIDEGVPELNLPPIDPKKPGNPPRWTLKQVKRYARELYGGFAEARQEKKIPELKPDIVLDTKPKVQKAQPVQSEVLAELAATMQEVERHASRLREAIEKLENQTDTVQREREKAEALGLAKSALKTLEVAEQRAKAEKARIEAISSQIIQADNVKRSAEEAAAARLALRTTLKIGVVLSYITDKILDGITHGLIEMPETIDGKFVNQLAQAALTISSAVDRSIRLERLRVGEPEKILGVKIGQVLDALTDEELEHVLQTGRLPESATVISLLESKEDPEKSQ